MSQLFLSYRRRVTFKGFNKRQHKFPTWLEFDFFFCSIPCDSAPGHKFWKQLMWIDTLTKGDGIWLFYYIWGQYLEKKILWVCSSDMIRPVNDTEKDQKYGDAAFTANVGMVAWNRLSMTDRSDLKLGSWLWNSFLPPPKHSLYHTLLTSLSTHGEVRDKRYPTIFTLSANKVSRFCEGKKKKKQVVENFISVPFCWERTETLLFASVWSSTIGLNEDNRECGSSLFKEKHI